MMRAFMLAAAGSLAAAASLGAQDAVQNYSSVVSYVVSIPSGDMRRFITTPSWLGISWEGVWAVGPRTSAGVAFSIHDFNHGFSGTANYPWGAVTGAQTKNLTVTTAMATGRWYPPADRTRRLHLGLGAGVAYSEETYQLGVSQANRSATHFAVAPEAGWQFPIVNGVDGMLGARYTIPATGGHYLGGARSHPFATVSFGVLER